MTVADASNPQEWDSFLGAQQFRPFLQSWTMGEVYRETHQEPLRLELRDGERIRGICLAVIVPARRGRHLSIPYGPVLEDQSSLPLLLAALAERARAHACTFLRMSPHWVRGSAMETGSFRALPSPLHLLGEETWYLPLTERDVWAEPGVDPGTVRSEEDLLAQMRKTTRNLIRRAEKEGVTVEASSRPMEDITHFLRLHEETRKRHHFVPYRDSFFRVQLERFSARGEATLYLARYQGEVIASSIHMHTFGETSYHHGASTHAHSKIPASYLLQWTAIRDALKRGDRIYSFWGIAPRIQDASGEMRVADPHHPFAGVTLFKTGFGGKLLPLVHCVDIPLSKRYYGTRAFEYMRKWKRGF